MDASECKKRMNTKCAHVKSRLYENPVAILSAVVCNTDKNDYDYGSDLHCLINKCAVFSNNFYDDFIRLTKGTQNEINGSSCKWQRSMITRNCLQLICSDLPFSISFKNVEQWLSPLVTFIVWRFRMRRIILVSIESNRPLFCHLNDKKIENWGFNKNKQFKKSALNKRRSVCTIGNKSTWNLSNVFWFVAVSIHSSNKWWNNWFNHRHCVNEFWPQLNAANRDFGDIQNGTDFYEIFIVHQFELSISMLIND